MKTFMAMFSFTGTLVQLVFFFGEIRFGLHDISQSDIFISKVMDGKIIFAFRQCQQNRAISQQGSNMISRW